MAASKSDMRSAGRTAKEFNFASFLWRFLASLVLVVSTYNPTQYSYWGWLQAARGPEATGLGPEHFVVGIVLLIGWVILLAATQRSLGFLGLLLGGALMGYGARLARGCTSGQALSGGAVMSVGSWAFMFAVFAGGYGLAWFVRRLWQGG